MATGKKMWFESNCEVIKSEHKQSFEIFPSIDADLNSIICLQVKKGDRMMNKDEMATLVKALSMNLSDYSDSLADFKKDSEEEMTFDIDTMQKFDQILRTSFVIGKPIEI